MRGTPFLLCLLFPWSAEPAAAAVLGADVPPEGWTDNGNNIQDYSTQKTSGLCQLGTCELLSDELRAMQEKLKGMEARLQTSESKMVAIESELQASMREVKQLHREDTKKIAFAASVGHDGHTGPYSRDTVLKYQNVITNIGKAYDPATGKFGAPVRGIYYFYFCYHASQDKGTSISLYKNSNLIATTSHHMTLSLGPENGSNGVALQLEEGDEVYVILNAKTWVWDGPNHDTIFTGFLVTM